MKKKHHKQNSTNKGKDMPVKDRELLELGRKLMYFYNTGYVSRKQALGFSFLRGIAVGFGATLGGTILIAITLWFLGLFEEVPLIGDFFELFDRSVEEFD